MSEPILGVMHEVDHTRSLGWEEYKHWTMHPLPTGWIIISEPEPYAEAVEAKAQETTGRPRVKALFCDVEVECNCGYSKWHSGVQKGDYKFKCPKCGALISFGIHCSGPFCFRAKKS